MNKGLTGFRQHFIILAQAPEAEPRDYSGAALLLGSEARRYITGIDLLVDGGFVL